MADEIADQIEGEVPDELEEGEGQEGEEEGQDADLDAEEEAEDAEEDKPFDGKFDPQRARRTIDRLRQENRELKKQQPATKDDPQREVMQLRTAMRLGIPETLAKRLHGETVEEMIEDASTLLDDLGFTGKSDDVAGETPKRRQPRPTLKGGSRPNEEPEPSAKKVVDAALGL